MERKQFLVLAGTKFERATQEDPHNADIWSDWGTLYRDFASDIEDTEERKQFFTVADSKYERATQEDPHNAIIWFNWGNLYIDRAYAAENLDSVVKFKSML